MADEIISRAEAKARGLTRYFTGKPCNRGHVAERYASIGKCVVCSYTDTRNWQVVHPEKVAAAREKYRVANPEKEKARRTVYRAENREEIRAKKAAYRAVNPEKIKSQEAAYRANSREKFAVRRKEYRLRNLEKVKALEAASRARNKEKRAAHNVAWRADNPDKVRAINRNRHARKRMAEGHNTAEDIQRIYTAQNGKCAYCKVKLNNKFHVDHIVPLAKGGSNWPANLQLTCGPCNSRKKDRDPLDHARELGMLL